jgi:hypothetical protein
VGRCAYSQNNNKGTAASLDQHLLPSRIRTRGRQRSCEARRAAVVGEEDDLLTASWKTKDPCPRRRFARGGAGIPSKDTGAPPCARLFTKRVPLVLEAHSLMCSLHLPRFDRVRHTSCPSAGTVAESRSRVYYHAGKDVVGLPSVQEPRTISEQYLFLVTLRF